MAGLFDEMEDRDWRMLIPALTERNRKSTNPKDVFRKRKFAAKGKLLKFMDDKFIPDDSRHKLLNLRNTSLMRKCGLYDLLFNRGDAIGTAAASGSLHLEGRVSSSDEPDYPGVGLPTTSNPALLEDVAGHGDIRSLGAPSDELLMSDGEIIHI